MKVLKLVHVFLEHCSHKFAVGIVDTRNFEILTISCGMILREKVVEIVDTLA